MRPLLAFARRAVSTLLPGPQASSSRKGEGTRKGRRASRWAAAAGLLALAGVGGGWAVSHAFADDEADKSWFVRYVEDTISTPDRKISLGQIDGALSSDVRISTITIADRQGVWLTIEGAHLVWSRLALLQKKLDIDLLEAQSITLARKPLPPEGVQPASNGFSLPELPVSVKLTKLAVPTVDIAAAVAGQDTTLTIDGGGEIAEGKAHADLTIKRVKPQGGELAFKADYDNASRQLALDLTFAEPKGGFVSTMLNLPGHPAIAFSVAGSGPLDNFAADIGLSADGTKLLGGKATIRQAEAGLAFTTDLSGTLERLVDPAYADFVRGASSLSIAAHQTADGGLVLERADLKSGIATLAATATLSADGFPTALTLDGRIGATDNHAIKLPGADATLTGLDLSARFGDGTWSGTFDVTSLAAGPVTVARAAIQASGEAQSLADPQKRSLTFTVDGRGEGLSSADAAIAKAMGTSAHLTAAGRWNAGQPVAIERVAVDTKGFTAGFTGRLDGNDLIGDTTLSAPDLSIFDGLAGRPLAGKADIGTSGRLALVGGAFDLKLDGSTNGLRLGESPLDPLLKGVTTIKGGVRRAEDGLHLDGLAVDNAQFKLGATGLYGVKTIDLTADVALANIRDLSNKASGPVRLHATMQGPEEKPAVAADITADDLALQGKHLKALRASFAGTLAGSAVDGQATLTGALGTLPVSAGATIATLPDGTRRLTNLTASAGAARIAGDLALTPAMLASGHVTADIPDLSAIAPLLLLKASGAVSADISLSAEGGKQGAAVKANAKAVTVETTRIGSATIDATAADLLGVPAIAGSAQARDVAAGSFVLRSLTANARSNGAGGTAFDVKGDLPRGALAAAGALAPAQGGFDLRLDTLTFRQDAISAALAAPVTVASRADGIAIPRAVLRIGKGGTVSVEGKAGETLALTAIASNLPVSLANMASPTLGASGTLSASVKVSGTRAAPVADFDASGAGLSVAAMRDLGLSPLQLSAKGRYAGNRVSIDAGVTGGGGIRVTAKGEVPLSGPGLSVAVQGSAPLAVANALLRERGAKVAGTLTLDARATGSIAAPQVSGSASLSGGSVNDPESGMQLSALAGSVRFDGNRATIERFSAATQGGGTLSVSGTVGLTGDFAADLAIALRNARLQQADLATATVSGNLTVRGPLMTRPTLGGAITIARAEITIPERFPSNAALLGVKHLAPPPEVRRTLARVKAAAGKRKGGGGAGIDLVLDLTIDAPSKIFVRGRGIDAELGGQLRLTGSVANLSPVGSFKLRRGSIDVIGQHIVLDSGEVTLLGDFNPQIDFAASVQRSSLSVTARVTGDASDPQIVLSSTPELPQDEVMAQFLFGHSIQDLSPLQMVQLATAVAQLAGGASGPDLLGSIRKSTGLDTLGVVTDAQGNAAVQAGRYIGENLYLGVQTGTGGSTNATINLDVTKNLKLRGEAGTDGSKAGIYYEREY